MIVCIYHVKVYGVVDVRPHAVVLLHMSLETLYSTELHTLGTMFSDVITYIMHPFFKTVAGQVTDKAGALHIILCLIL